MGPYKCPDCGIWWAGLEHRCSPAAYATASTIRAPYPHSPEIPTKIKPVTDGTLLYVKVSYENMPDRYYLNWDPTCGSYHLGDKCADQTGKKT